MNSAPFLNRQPIAPQDVQFHIVVPFYNCQKWITRCLASLAEQTHPKVNVICMDDASTDNGGAYAQMYCNHHEGWMYWRNEQNIKCPENIVRGIEKLGQIEQRDVIFLLDGDDYLPHENVLKRYGELFAEADIWLTYGQYMPDPPDWRCAPAVPPPAGTYLNRSWRSDRTMFFNHPIVFRKFLWDSIPEQEFKDKDGNWFTAGYDRAIIYPLIERSSPYSGETDMPHWRFINEVGYVYNSENPISDWRVSSAAAEHVNEVHYREPLPPLNPRYYG